MSLLILHELRFVPLSRGILITLLFLIMPVGSTALAQSRLGETSWPVELTRHHLELEISPGQQTVKALDALALVSRQDGVSQLSFLLNSNLRISKIEQQGKSLPFVSRAIQEPRVKELYPGSRLVAVELPRPLFQGQGLEVKISYEGRIHDPPRQERDLRFVTGSQTSGTISSAGVYLAPSTNWYPDHPLSLSLYRLAITLPKGWEAVTQGKMTQRKELEDKITTLWESRTPAEGLTLVAGQYQVARDQLDGIEIATYLTPANANLSQDYIAAATRYISFYSRLLGPYPFEKFAIVENFFPSGYGLPSFTLLGGGVIERRYTQPYSLGHEIVHNWFGNYLLTYQEENWAEALTTYLANYLYQEYHAGQQEATRLRYRMLQEYSTYVRPENDYPLARFSTKKGTADQAIGYQKGAMVFHMLRRLVGEEKFFQALKTLVKQAGGKRVSWGNIQMTFQTVTGADLGHFFNQWVQRKGAPSLRLRRAEVRKEKGGYRIDISLQQEGEPFSLNVPVVVESASGTRKLFNFVTQGETTEVQVVSEEEPGRIVIDPEFHLFRRFSPEEMPPFLNQTLYDARVVVAYPTQGSRAKLRAYQEIAEKAAVKEGLILKADTEVTRDDLTTSSLFLLGGLEENQLLNNLKDRLSPRVELTSQGFSLQGSSYQGPGFSLLASFRSPFASGKTISLFLALSEEALARIAPLVYFYGWESYLVFKASRPVARGDFAATSPLEHRWEKKGP